MWSEEPQRIAAEASLRAYQQMLSAARHGTITTELVQESPEHRFFYAEDYHQQYLAKNPGGYCGLGGTGVACPVGIAL
jgi:peptide-methionine (S)-S-oxide reductase